jgi:DNA-binding MarR family transcriptional regulator
MSDEPWHLDIVTPALLRHARTTYGSAMRIALEDAGYDDIPPNGLYVIGALAMDETMPLSQVIQDLRVSKQSAGQLVDALVTRGYLDRDTDPGDRRRLTVSLTARGRDAASVQAAARQEIDEALVAAIGADNVDVMREGLAALIDLRRMALG